MTGPDPGLDIGSFVALGDSFTEGLNDPHPGGGFMGWADRVAAVLAGRERGFRYANLAVRGKLLGQVIAEQVPRAIELAPDLVSLAAGGNDILRGSDVDVLASQFEAAVASLGAAGCRVLIFTGFDPRSLPVIRLIRGRVAAYDMHLRGIADAYGCDVVDLWSMRVLHDPRAWSADRLHLSAEGHRRIALRTCEVLGIPVTEDWRAPWPAEDGAIRPGNGAVRLRPGAVWLAARRQDARWATQHAMPWVRRRLTGTSTGDGLSPKRPDLLPPAVGTEPPGYLTGAPVNFEPLVNLRKQVRVLPREAHTRGSHSHMRKHLFTLCAASGVVALSVSAAQAGTGGVAPPAGVVSSTPATGTPHFSATQDNPVEQIRQLVQCGTTMYAVGTFTAIVKGSTTYQRENIFSFSATAPYTMTTFAPDVVGTATGSGGVINSIAFVGGNCSDAYIGGHFTSINGTSVLNIAEISTSTGNVVSTFGSSANGVVDTLVGYGTHVLAGGYYTSINNSKTDPYMTSLDSTTGKDDGFLNLNISGNYSYAPNNATRVYNQALSHGGTLDLVMGDFTSVGGVPRQQIFMLNLATDPATVTGWTSPEWDGSQGEATPKNPTNGYPYQCATNEPFYIQAAAWSPDDSTVYIGTTGYHPNGWPVGATLRNGLCDAAAAFPSTQTSVLHEWVNYTGCDSLYSAAADAEAAYFGGHERYSMNPDDCNALGPTAYNAPGMEGLQPTTGDLYVNSTNTAGYYSRARGAGADDMLLTSAGLWIASDNLTAAAMCGGHGNLSGICFLPYTG